MISPAHTISESVVIERPILDVFEYVINPRHLPEWVPFFSSVEVPDAFSYEPPHNEFSVRLGMWPLVVPARVRCLNVVMGRAVTYQSTRSEFISQTATYLFQPTSLGTMLTAHHVPWGFTSMSPVLSVSRPWLTGVLKETLLQLKQRLEARRFERATRRIFFSYRRDHDEYISGRVVEALTREFGDGALYRDIDSTHAGDFAKRIRKEIEGCKVFVAFIGPAWVPEMERRERERKRRARNMKGRLEAAPDDWVRFELQTAIATSRPVDPNKSEVDPESKVYSKGVLNSSETVPIIPIMVPGVLPRGEDFSTFVSKLPEDLRALGRYQIRNRLHLDAWRVVA